MLHSCLKSLKIGATQVKKDLLREGSTNVNIRRGGENTVRQSCIAIFLDDKILPQETVKLIKIGMCMLLLSCYRKP